MQPSFRLEQAGGIHLLQLVSSDATNRLTRESVLGLTEAVEKLRTHPLPLLIAGNSRFFSVGADLNEIASLTGPAALEFARMGQSLMDAIASFPAPVAAAIEGHCMGGGFDLALACHYRIAGPQSVFGHRGAALGLITGWGGTQRLPRLIGKSPALQLFTAAEKIDARQALALGLVHAIAERPLEAAVQMVTSACGPAIDSDH